MIVKKSILLFLFIVFASGNLLLAEDDFPCLENVTIATASGETSLLTCQGDSVDGPVKFKTSTQAMPFAYVLVDTEGTILHLGLGTSIDLSPYQDGEYRVYAFSFLGTLLAEVGDNLFTTELASYCYELTVNYVTVNSGAPEAGSISFDGSALVCVGDDQEDVITFTTTSVSENYAYFATDQNNTILEISTSGSFDFNSYDEGTYFIWGFAYFGNLTATTGMNITEDELADGCSDFSDTNITITASNPDGGTVTLEDGSSSYDVCDGANADVISFISTTASEAPYVLVMTDEAGIITEILSDNSVIAGELSFGTNYVYGISYTGTSNIEVGMDINGQLSNDCFDVSAQPVTLFKEAYQAGFVSLTSGETEVSLCVADGTPDILDFLASGVSGGNSFSFVITDDENNILGFSNTGSHDFDQAPAGTCRIWSVIYDGNLLVDIGDNLDAEELADGCFDRSDNYITVYREAVNGGTISFENNGATYYQYCSNDAGTPLNFVSEGSLGEHFRYIVTDEMGTITGIHPVSTPIVPVTLLSYTRHIYWLSFTGDDFTGDEIAALVGQNISTAELRESCHHLSSNYAELEVIYVDGGSVQLESGATATIVCNNENANGLLTFETTTGAFENEVLLLTDAANNIITFITGNTVNFNVAANGDYRIWNVSYTGELTAQINDPALETALSDACYDLSDNFVEIYKTDIEGGTISTLEGDTFLMFCADGDIPTGISFTNDNAIGNGYGYILTDETGTIISTIDGNSFEFASLPIAGILHFWGVAYTGVLDAPFGENIETATLANECFDLSDNYVEIIYENAQAGSLTVNDGLTALEVCVGDGNPDIVNFEVQDATHLNYAYFVTDMDDYLLGVIFEDSFDFDNAIGGDCKIYGVSYSGNLSLIPGDNIFEVSVGDDCWDITSEFVSLTKTAVDGGLIFADNPDDIIYVCAGDTIPDVITFSNSSSASEANYQYILTTVDNLILSFIEGDQQDFEDTGFNTLRVWGLSYTGELNLAFGSFIDQVVFSDECYTLSENHLTVVRDLPEGGDLSTIDGETDIQVCLGAGSEIVEMATTSTSNSGYVYLLLDESGIILEVFDSPFIDLNNTDPGFYRLWGLSYTGQLFAEPGLLATQVDLSASCFELSTNPVEITIPEAVDGGTLSVLDTEETVFYTCPGDEVSDLLVLSTTSLDPDYIYVITDAEGNIVIPQIIGTALDFDGSDPGEFHIYGISYNGNLTIGFGVNVFEDALSDICYTTSDNHITVFVNEPQGGTVTSDMGDDVTIVVGDEEDDELTFSTTDASDSPYVYVITDDSDEILGFVDGDTHNFESAAPGICRVWGVAYTGEIVAQAGDTLTNVVFSDDCFGLSDNYVTITRTDEAGTGAMAAANNAFIDLITYPNPAVDRITASFEMENQLTSEAELLVLNLNGQIVKQLEIATNDGQNKVDINISDLLPGMYFIHLRNDQQSKSIRFSKQ